MTSCGTSWTQFGNFVLVMVHKEPCNSLQDGDKRMILSVTFTILRGLFATTYICCKRVHTKHNTSTTFESGNVICDIMPLWMNDCDKLCQ